MEYPEEGYYLLWKYNAEGEKIYLYKAFRYEQGKRLIWVTNDRYDAHQFWGLSQTRYYTDYICCAWKIDRFYKIDEHGRLIQ